MAVQFRKLPGWGEDQVYVKDENGIPRWVSIRRPYVVKRYSVTSLVPVDVIDGEQAFRVTRHDGREEAFENADSFRALLRKWSTAVDGPSVTGVPLWFYQEV